MVWEVQIHFGNPTVGRLVALSFERRLTHQKLIAQDAKAPQVYVLVVGFAFNHLWRKVIQGAAERGSA